jgi:ATP phosphoribosyltransferase
MEASAEYFAASGLAVNRTGGSRNYIGSLSGIEGVEVRFMSAAEIATGLIAGDVHLGITGRDLLHEQTQEPDDVVAPLSALGFGHADVVVAVPQSWIDVSTMADLAEVTTDFRASHHRPLRVATKFFSLTRAFFADNGILDYRIVESLGATEGAPAAGTAEIIVDITSSGATLEANKLKILEDGVILNSEAFLTASIGAPWPKEALDLAASILDRIAARERAVRLSEVRFAAQQLDGADLEKNLAKFAATLPFGMPGEGEQETVVHIVSQQAYGLVAKLRSLGCTSLSVHQLDYVYTDKNPLFEALKVELKI